MALRTLATFTLALPVLEHIDKAKVTLQRYGDQKISLSDATIASIAKRAGAQVLIFDRRPFDLMGQASMSKDKLDSDIRACLRYG